MISKNRIKYLHSFSLKKNRDAEGVFIAEGTKLVEELLPVFRHTYIAATKEWKSEHDNIECDIVTDTELQRISFQKTPQQVMAVFNKPEEECIDVVSLMKDELCLALDGVQDPGNVGTIIRIADWFGVNHIFCNIGTADIYSPKVVQATMGALARVKVHYVDLENLLTEITDDIPVYGTFLDGENIYSKKLSDNGLIIMGNEGNGISKEVAMKVNERLYIPSYPIGETTSESLNVAVATAIVCAEFRRVFSNKK